uniref:Uncharacterized protein n=1 Tax=Caenorhabditis japonica TaxID=281687 RepID=A0A8R1HUX4_CAEJA
MFVYLLFTARCTMFGNYKFLLLGFALFNLVYSVFDVLVPIVISDPEILKHNSRFQGIHEYRFSFIAFVIDGWFAELSNFNNNVLLIRCCLVSSCYSVLVSHFLYRYFLILRSSYTREHFTHFITFAISLFAAYFAIWAKVSN